MAESSADPEAPEFDRAIGGFMTFARIEAGLAAATLEAYARDLQEMLVFLLPLGVREPKDVTVDHLAAHMRHLSRERGLDARSIAASAIKALGRGDERALKLIVG